MKLWIEGVQVWRDEATRHRMNPSGRWSRASVVLVFTLLVLAQSCGSRHDDGPTGSTASPLAGSCGGISLLAYTDAPATTYNLSTSTQLLIPASVSISLVVAPNPPSGNTMAVTLAFQSANVTCTYSRTTAGNASDFDALPLTSCTGGGSAGGPITESSLISLYFVPGQGGGELSASAAIAYNLDDGLACTADSCVNGIPTHTTITNQAVPGSHLCPISLGGSGYDV